MIGAPARLASGAERWFLRVGMTWGGRRGTITGLSRWRLLGAYWTVRADPLVLRSVVPHCLRVAHLTVAFARMAGVSQEELEEAALMHDVGKVILSPRIICASSALSPVEWHLLQAHPWMAALVLGECFGLRRAARYALDHHENWDGSGYPRGLRGTAISLGGRLIRIVDSFDAMTHHRPYVTRKSVSQALHEIEKGAGVLYDSQLAAGFCKAVQSGCISLHEADGRYPDMVIPELARRTASFLSVEEKLPTSRY